MKKEGTYLTKKEKQDKARAMQMLEQMKAAGTGLPPFSILFDLLAHHFG